MNKTTHFTKQVIEKIRQFLAGEKPLGFDEFMRITHFEYDSDNFRYYIADPGKTDGSRIFEITSEVIWLARREGRLKDLMFEIIKQIEWIAPWYYGLGLYRDELIKKRNYEQQDR